MIVKYVCLNCGHTDHEIEDLSEVPFLKCLKCGTNMKQISTKSIKDPCTKP